MFLLKKNCIFIKKMEATEIKLECEKMYSQIKEAQEKLIELRAICKHENVHDGLYSWRLGTIIPTKICSDCGTPIKS